MTAKTILFLAALLGGSGVMAGAFGAHALPNYLDRFDLDELARQRRIENLEIGVRYQMYHALALLGLGLLQMHRSSSSVSWTAGLWLAGVLLFSGCLYGYALTGQKTLAMIVPLGGLAFILGWCSLAWLAFRSI